MSYLYVNVDSMGERYIELGEEIGSVKAIDVIAVRGEYCLRCGKGPRTTVIVGKRRPGRWRDLEICASCRAPWSGAERELPKGWIQIQRRPSTPLPVGYDEWRFLRPIIENRPRRLSRRRWDHAVIAWLAYLHPAIGSYTSVVRYGQLHRPQFDSWWTEWLVRRAIERAREIVGRRAVRAGARLVLAA